MANTNMDSGTKLCTNCKRDIGTANYVMHEMHCRRHIVLCEHCGEPVHRSEVEQHFNDLHAKVPCEKCQQMVPRQDMAKHQAEDCMKKLMKCEFCDLTLPKNELDNHLDYCGSRTECCPLCRQYIMQKEKLRHESSRCTYPEAAAAPPQPPPLVDPFSMGDLQQFMTNAMLGNISTSNNIFRNGKVLTNRKSNLNAQMAKNILLPEVTNVDLNPPSADVDYDSMLALQLAHEDWLQDNEIQNETGNWNYLPHYLEESSSEPNDFGSYLDVNSMQWSFLMPHGKSEPAALDSQTTQDNDTEENMKIPCEFCEEDIALNFYTVHMESCPLAVQRRAADLNNEQVPILSNNTKAAIPVINNLRPSSPPPPAYITVSDDDDDNDSVMLPCEFCQEIFPSDLIIQHQSVCQADGLITPRATTPIRTSRNTKSQQPSSQAAFQSSTRSPPRQQNSRTEVEFVSREEGSESAKPELSNKRMHMLNESSSNKYSPAYNSRFDEAFTRPPVRSSRQHSISSDDAPETKSESRSVQRTRASLNKLLQEDPVLLVRRPETESKENRRKELGTLRNHDTNKTDLRDRKTKVDSRTVARQLEEGRHKPIQGSSGRSPLPQNGSTQSRNSEMPSTRNRQRADNVFSPELRLKPNNNPPPKKR